MRKIAVLLTGRLQSSNEIEFNQTLYDKSLQTLKLIDNNITFFISINQTAENPEYTKRFMSDLNISQDQINIENTQPPSELLTYPKRIETIYHNAYSMFYHNKRCFELMETYQNKHQITFDTILKFRADLFSNTEFHISEIEQDTIYIPNSFDFSGINDQIAYGTPNSMKIYTNCVDHIINYCKKDIIFHPETILKHHLVTNNLKIIRFRYPYQLIKYS